MCTWSGDDALGGSTPRYSCLTIFARFGGNFNRKIIPCKAAFWWYGGVGGGVVMFLLHSKYNEYEAERISQVNLNFLASALAD